MSMPESDIKLPRLPVADWHRRVRGPFRGYIGNTLTGMATVYDRPGPASVEGDNLHASKFLETMAAETYQRPDTRMMVLDADGWIIYGYSTEASFLERFYHPAWMGCEFGFAIVESLGLVDPIELAMRESIAREASDQPDWWKP